MANKRLSAVITIGGAVTSALKTSLGDATRRINGMGDATRKLAREQKMLGDSIQSFGRMGKNIDGLRTRYQAVTAELEKQRRVMERMQNMRANIQAGRDRMMSAGATVGALTAAASTGFVPIVQAAQFEKAMLGVAKQVEGARDKSGQLTAVYHEMARQVQALGREIPLATNEIAEMVAAGARMGVARDELIGFTRTAANMATAFDLPAGELADQMGKVAGLFKIPIPAIGELADAVNYLDDNAISKGGDIIEVLQRIGGTAQTLRMSAKDAAALGSTFLTLGASAEVAATASNAVMRELSIATMQPKRFQAGLKAIGMTAKKVQADMSKDATGTIQRVLEALQKLPNEKRLEVTTQLFGKEYGDDVAKLAEGLKEYRRQLQLANSEEAQGSMAREAQAVRQTTIGQWQLMKNTLTEVSVNIGSVLLPAINSVLGAIAPVAASVADWVRENKTLVGNIVTVVGTIGGLVAGAKLVTFAFGAAQVAFWGLAAALQANPIGIAATLMATAAVMVYKNWEPIKGFFVDLFQRVSGAVVTAAESIKATFANLWANVTEGARAAMDWVVRKIESVGRAWQKAKSIIGMGDDPAAPGAAEAPDTPALPPMARRGSVNIQDSSQTTFNITQQPGQDAKALADEVAKRLEQKRAVQQRGVQYDAMGNAW